MFSGFWSWLLAVFISTGFLGFCAFLFRETIGKFFAKSVEHIFEKKIEDYKASIRGAEMELDQIRSFLSSSLRERDSAIQAKRLEAAETLLRARHAVYQLTMLVEYMKILNTDAVMKSSEDQKIAEFIGTLVKPFSIDERVKQIGEFDKSIPRLYLSERSLKAFDVYEGIVVQAAMMMKIYSFPLKDKSKLLKQGTLIEKIIELVPNSKEGFDKWGEAYAYYWSSYFYDEVLHALRYEVSGADDVQRDAKSVEQMAIISRRAQFNMRASLEQTGLPDNLLQPQDGAAASWFAAEKASK